jgi:hypothetical protein
MECRLCRTTSELSKPNKIFLPEKHKNSASGKILPVELMENKI